MVDKTISAKADLKELLKECKLITHKSIELVKDNPNHLKEIKDILKVDKRCLLLDYLVEEGTNVVLDYLGELQKCCPPPPPSASATRHFIEFAPLAFSRVKTDTSSDPIASTTQTVYAILHRSCAIAKNKRVNILLKVVTTKMCDLCLPLDYKSHNIDKTSHVIT
uniref:Uncharacterized protein n=1 Tax=Glossina palpalis gambiensis TaxID=67801 RepID=A0A1B0C2Z6_9MUSC